MISCNWGEIAGSISRGGTGLLSSRSFMVAKGLGPRKGTSPVSISYSMTPNAYRSLRPSPHPALRSPTLGRKQTTFPVASRLQHRLNQTQYPAVGHLLGHKRYQFRMVH